MDRVEFSSVPIMVGSSLTARFAIDVVGHLRGSSYQYNFFMTFVGAQGVQPPAGRPVPRGNVRAGATWNWVTDQPTARRTQDARNARRVEFDWEVGARPMGLVTICVVVVATLRNAPPQTRDAIADLQVIDGGAGDYGTAAAVGAMGASLDDGLRGLGRGLDATTGALRSIERQMGQPTRVVLQRNADEGADRRDEGLWVQILAVARETRFDRFANALNNTISGAAAPAISDRLHGVGAYTQIRDATAQFIRSQTQGLQGNSVAIRQMVQEAEQRLLRSPSGRVVGQPPPGVNEVAGRLTEDTTRTRLARFDARPWRNLCFVELIWSYWHEEGMLVQTMKAISRRFQNRHAPGSRDPLASLEIDPLRPLSNVLWGYVNEEPHRLSVLRRAHEYEHHYGLSLEGAATAGMRPADRRSRFLELFHNLLFATVQFYKRDDDNTVSADGFPVLAAIRALHFLIAEGAHNQFGDLPEVARQEMLLEQWLLARPETREFLRGRAMVPYPEPWMAAVDTMKNLQGWADASVIQFNDLARFGEQILLSVRYGTWATVDVARAAVAWARFWRPEIQGYIQAYRAVTGVDLSAEVSSARMAEERYVAPSVLLRRRLATRRAH